jgi:hypothetical protein
MSDKIAEIRKRHSKRSEIDQSGCYRLDGLTYMGSLAQSQEDVDTLLAEDARHRAENERLRAEIARMQELMRGISINMVDLIEPLTRDRDTLLAEVERFCEALMEISQYETSAPAGFEWDIVVEELVEIARKALESKP